MKFKHIVKPLVLSKEHPVCVIKLNDSLEKSDQIQHLLDEIATDYQTFSLLFTSDARTTLQVCSKYLYCKLNFLDHLDVTIQMNDNYIAKTSNNSWETRYLYIIDVDSFKGEFPTVIQGLLAGTKRGICTMFLTTRERNEFYGWDYYEIGSFPICKT